MTTITPRTKTFVIPDMADRYPGAAPPDGYVITYVASDGYYIAKPPSKLLVVASTAITPYTVVNEDLILVSHAGAATVNLPAAPQTGYVVYIKDLTGNASINNVTINAAPFNIDGAASYVINTNFGTIRTVFTGATWAILTKF